MGNIKLDSGFLLLYDWLPAFESLPGEDFKLLFMALVNFQRERTPIPTFKNPLCNIFAQMIEPTLNRRLVGQVGGKKATAMADEDTGVGTGVGTGTGTGVGTGTPSRADINRAKHIIAEERGGERSISENRANPFSTSSPDSSAVPLPPPTEKENFSLDRTASPLADRGADIPTDPVDTDSLEALIAEGISEGYINERRHRAEDFARRHKRRLSSVLREWWERDKSDYRGAGHAKTGAVFPQPSESSFDTDDFFAVAVAKSIREMEETYGKSGGG